MDTQTIIILTVAFLAAAILYSSVGHAGASAYLVIMGLSGIPQEIMRPTALALNILVAAIGAYKYYRAGQFTWRLFWPFAVTSIPFAFIGGAISLPGTIYKTILGFVLLYAAFQLFLTGQATAVTETKPPALPVAMIIGVGIGLLSGLTGVGGGIFLSPVLVLLGWADTRHTAGVAAPFILVNSIAGLLGNLSAAGDLPGIFPVWAVIVIIGGWIGAEYGSRRLNIVTLRRLLALVLALGGSRLLTG